MFVPQRGQQPKRDESIISTQDESSQEYSAHESSVKELLGESPMWPDRSIAGQIQRGGAGLDITNNYTPRYVGSLTYPGYEISSLEREEANYTYCSTPSSNIMGGQEPCSDPSLLTDLGIGRLHIEDGKKPTTSCKGNTSNGRDDCSKDTKSNVEIPIIVHYDVESAVHGSDEERHGGKYKVENAMKEDDPAITLDFQNPIYEAIYTSIDEKEQSLPNSSLQDISPPNVLELTHSALKSRETGSERDLMLNTDVDSDRESVAEDTSDITAQSLERLCLAHIPGCHSKSAIEFRTHVSHEGSASTSTTASKSTNRSTNKLSSSNQIRKRMLDNGEDHPPDEDDHPTERPRFDASEPRDLKVLDKFACHFVKHDPETYNPTNYHTCATTPWYSITRLKEHLLRVHVARIYCENCRQTFEDVAALKSLRTVPDAELERVCDHRDPPKLTGTITPAMAGDLKERWRNATPLEKWNRIYGILFPNETIVPLPYFDATPNPFFPVGQSQPMSNPEMLFWHKLKCAMRGRVDRMASESIRSLTDDDKAEMVKAMIEECISQSRLSYSSPNETPKIRASSRHRQHGPHGPPIDEKTMEPPIENWDSSVGEGSNQGLGLNLPSSDSLPSSPGEPSSAGKDMPRCRCQGKCTCPPWPGSYFEDQLMPLEDSDSDQWRDISDGWLGF